MPDALFALLSNETIPIGPAFQLTVVDDAGFGHSVLLSAAECWAPSPDVLRFALWASSRTVRYLAQRPRATVQAVAGEGFHEVRLETRAAPGCAALPGLACFVGQVVSAAMQQVAYARLTSGIAFSVEPGHGTAERWARQRQALRDLR